MSRFLDFKIAVARRAPWLTSLKRKKTTVEVEPDPEYLASLPGLFEAMYQRDPETDSVVLARVPISKLRRHNLGIRVNDPEVNPFTRTVQDFVAGSATTYQSSVLKTFHDTWHPTTLAEFHGLSVAPDSELNQPLAMDRVPWEPYLGRASLEEERDVREARQIEKFGVPETGWHGVSYFGPVSQAVGEHRFVKHCRLAASISADGYEPLPHIEIQLLASPDDWVAVVRDGKHRSTALSVLGVEEVVVLLGDRFPVVRRDDVHYWPGVTTGLFTVDEALEVFDRFMAGDPPRGFPIFAG